MIYPVEKLLINRGKVLCIHQKDTVRTALIKMVQNDFSQLPVIDDQGNLVGIISEKIITRTYYHLNEKVSLFDLTVDHCQSPAITLSADQDIFDALDRLQTTFAVVVTQGRKPIGILTNFDTTHFFRNLTEGLIIVEDIETTLRQYIEALYSTEERLDQALANAFGATDNTPNRQYDKLTFGEYTRLILHKKNWPDFESYFTSIPLFEHLMNEVRQIRNQLAHFRGELEIIQFDALYRARDWLSSRRKPPQPAILEVDSTLPVTHADAVHLAESFQLAPTLGSDEVATEQSKYTPLTAWLQRQKVSGQIHVSFAELETILQASLPVSAREHRSWWSNATAASRHSRAWLATGWLVADVDLTNAVVTFQRTVGAYYQLFYEELVQRIKTQRPGLIDSTSARPKAWLSFGAGVSGFYYTWTFVRGHVFAIELYIATGSSEINKQHFDWLHTRRQLIEGKLGVELNWSRLDNKGASRVRLERSNAITDPPKQLEELKTWAVEKMLAFVDAFQPSLRELPRN